MHRKRRSTATPGPCSEAWTNNISPCCNGEEMEVGKRGKRTDKCRQQGKVDRRTSSSPLKILGAVSHTADPSKMESKATAAPIPVTMESVCAGQSPSPDSLSERPPFGVTARFSNDVLFRRNKPSVKSFQRGSYQGKSGNTGCFDAENELIATPWRLFVAAAGPLVPLSGMRKSGSHSQASGRSYVENSVNCRKRSGDADTKFAGVVLQKRRGYTPTSPSNS